jgi:hypothetical protein
MIIAYYMCNKAQISFVPYYCSCGQNKSHFASCVIDVRVYFTFSTLDSTTSAFKLYTKYVRVKDTNIMLLEMQNTTLFACIRECYFVPTCSAVSFADIGRDLCLILVYLI